MKIQKWLQRAAVFAACAIAGRSGLGSDKFKLKGTFVAEHWRNGSLIGSHEIPNTVTTDGKNNIFNIMFNSVTQITAWYIGLINNASFTAINVADTMASHSGWTEWTSYTVPSAARQAWSVTNSTTASMTNGTAASFTMSANGTLQGIFISSSNTQGGTTGVLWTEVLFSSPVAVLTGDQIKITYTLSA